MSNQIKFEKRKNNNNNNENKQTNNLTVHMDNKFTGIIIPTAISCNTCDGGLSYIKL